MQLEIQNKMYEGGKLRSYPNFEKDVLSINEKYNRNHLQAEWQTARQAGHHVRNWEQYQENKDLFPNLKYKTVGDRRVRKEHANLHNVVKPIDDPFWDKYYPPNGWRCRCTVVQTAEPITKHEIQDESIKPEFQINVGKEQRIFSEQHPYFAIPIENEKAKAAFEYSKLEAPLYTAYKAKNGATVKINPFYDKKDFLGNYRAAVKLADAGNDVEIRPHIDSDILEGWTNPEYKVKGIIADRKAIEKVSATRRNIDRAKNQMYDKPFNKKPKTYSIVFDFVNIKSPDWTSFKTELNKKITGDRGKYIESVFVIYKDAVIELTRKEIVERDYTKLHKIQ